MVGVGLTTLAVSAALAGLGSPVEAGSAAAAPVAGVSASATAVTGSAAIDAERVARQAEQNRSAARKELSLSAVGQAVKRSAALQDQSRSITRQEATILAERRLAAVEAAAAKARDRQQKARAAAAKAEKAAAKARREQIRAQGYEPGTTDPRDIARQILQSKYGYGADEYGCFNNIIIRESNWDVSATNASSGAYGLPQALPGSKMATVASDWRTNPATQITWAIGYMKSRYGSPCAAWGFKSSHGWY